MISFISKATGDTMTFRNLAEQVNYNTEKLSQIGGQNLPDVDLADNGKIVRVVNGVWVKSGDFTSLYNTVSSLSETFNTYIAGEVASLQQQMNDIYDDVQMTIGMLRNLADGIVITPEEEE